MSWSFNAFGKPENIVAALEKESDKLSGQCKIEFDEAKPHLVGLLRQNFITPDSGYAQEPTIDFEASGSGSTKQVDGETKQTQRSCTVRMVPTFKNVV